MSDSKCFFCRGSVKGWPTTVYRRNMGRSLIKDVNKKNMDLLKMTLFTSLMFLFIFPNVITLMFFLLRLKFKVYFFRS